MITLVTQLETLSLGQQGARAVKTLSLTPGFSQVITRL